MESRLKYAVLGSFLIICLMVLGAYAVTSSNGEFTVTPDVLYITWQDAGTGFGCYANNTTVINNLASSLDVTIVNTTTVGGMSFYVNNGDTNNTVVSLGAGAVKYPVLKFSPGATASGTYTGNITVYNTTNSTEKLEFTVKVVVPQTLQNLVNVHIAPKINLGQNTVMKANFSINNTESYPLVITGIDNRTMMTYGSNKMSYTHSLVPTTVPANTNVTYVADIVINTADTNNVAGIYSDQIKITSSNGCPNQTYNITISANLTNHMDVTIANGSAVLTNTGENVTLRVTPKYLNGTMASGFTNNSFTVTFEHRYDANLSSSAVYSATAIPTSSEGATYYTINATLPSNMLGGDYRVKVTATDGSNSGTGYFDYYSVQKTALKLVHTLDCDGQTYDVGDAITCTHKIYNYGNISATAVNLTYTGCSSYLSADSYSSTIGTIAAGSYASKAATFTASAAISSGCFLSFEAVAANGVWDGNLRTTDLLIKVASDEDDDTTTSTAETVGSSSAHKLTITPSADFEIEQGGSSTKSVVVKNGGSYTERNVALTLSGMDSSWYSVDTEPQTIVVTLEKNYIVSFIIPDDAEPIEYTITYKAKSDDAEGTATGKIKVLPSDDTEAEIAANLTEYQEWYGSVLKMFDETKLSGGNSTELDAVESMLDQITGLLTKADSHIKLGEYYEAYQALKEARILLEEAEDDLTGEKSKFESLIFDKFIVVGAGIVIAAGFAGFYFYRQTRGGYRSYRPRRGNLHIHGKRKVAGMKLKFEHLKHEIKHKKDKLLRNV